MTWNEVSPGIWKGMFEGFNCHKIQGQKPIPTRKIAADGSREMRYEYTYVAIKAGEPGSGNEPTRFSGGDWDRIRRQIEATLTPTLFG